VDNGLFHHATGGEQRQGALGVGQDLHFWSRRMSRRLIRVSHMKYNIVVCGGDCEYLGHPRGVARGGEGCWMGLLYTGM